jgi:thiamine-monophosphate kinase
MRLGVMKNATRNEFDIISKYFSPLSKGFKGAFGLKDDAAVISPKKGYDLVITKDAIVENVHFFQDDKPYGIALKLLGVNLSDLAAMGAKPIGYLLAVILPRDIDDEWFEEFSSGLGDGMAKFGGALIGGDTTSHDGPLTLSLTAIGEVPHNKALKRSGAKEGDLIFVSGNVGDSYLGLQILKDNIDAPEDAKKYLIERYDIPHPRTELGTKLIGIATSCVDISDGLVADLGHICETSKVGAEVNFGDVPFSDFAESIIEGRRDAINMLTGGDDYELLFTAPATAEQTITDLSKELNISIKKIGKMVVGERIKVLDKNGVEIVITHGGYQHF